VISSVRFGDRKWYRPKIDTKLISMRLISKELIFMRPIFIEPISKELIFKGPISMELISDGPISKELISKELILIFHVGPYGVEVLMLY